MLAHRGFILSEKASINFLIVFLIAFLRFPERKVYVIEFTPETPGGSRDSKNSPDSTDRKKATHLRCERQRREAINIGYQELKELLPASFSPIGCKTTNAAILFRAADYLNHLKKEEENLHETIVQLTAQVSALELIAKQYENMAVSSCTSNRSSIQCQIMQAFLDSCFASFRRQ
uniref:BHLH domain-containing protein n=1 Tax=Loa loa TaxID=7209 RepID=A0A1I7VDA4_LOALO